jgi:hypothetical protein
MVGISSTAVAQGLNLLPPPLSAKARGHAAALSASAGLDTVWREARELALKRAIHPDDYQCGPTDFDMWFWAKLGWIQNPNAFLDIAINYGALDWPTYYSFRFDQNAGDDYLGVSGAQTREMKKRFGDLQKFWDVNTSNVLLQGMHGAVIQEDAKMVPFVQWYFGGLDPVTAQSIVDYVQSVIEGDPGLGYNNPLFTLNAFAVTTEGESPFSPFYGIPDKIVLGDGIIEALTDLGLGINAPDSVLSHEFGHHVQFELGVFDTYDGTPEATRRTELMADAFGAYYCAHSRGASFQSKRIAEVFRSSYLIGDCAFDSPGHHGTPDQREAAAQWGASVATASKKQGKIASSSLMLQLFDAQLPTLIAPDAP